ncbi:hypothetical protein SLS62_008835 [Diatrype stigma]|uniref:Uncharacterized protein n=1 Tax=Diatrype stigma TaxID=117547 RepID=A0AAN9YM70_9PEZI
MWHPIFNPNDRRRWEGDSKLNVQDLANLELPQVVAAPIEAKSQIMVLSRAVDDKRFTGRFLPPDTVWIFDQNMRFVDEGGDATNSLPGGGLSLAVMALDHDGALYGLSGDCSRVV